MLRFMFYMYSAAHFKGVNYSRKSIDVLYSCVKNLRIWFFNRSINVHSGKVSDVFIILDTLSIFPVPACSLLLSETRKRMFTSMIHLGTQHHQSRCQQKKSASPVRLPTANISIIRRDDNSQYRHHRSGCQQPISALSVGMITANIGITRQGANS